MSQKGFDFGDEPARSRREARAGRRTPLPRRARPAPKPEASRRRALTVSELTERIQGVLETEFLDVWVEGEISNLKLATSGPLVLLPEGRAGPDPRGGLEERRAARRASARRTA